MQRRSYIHGICSEIFNRQIPGSQVLGKRRCSRVRRGGDTRITTEPDAGFAQSTNSAPLQSCSLVIEQ